MKILVSGGKTMGHISPLIGIIISLKDEYDFIYFGLNGSMEEEICRQYQIPFHGMNLIPFNRKNIFINFKTFYLKKERGSWRSCTSINSISYYLKGVKQKSQKATFNHFC